MSKQALEALKEFVAAMDNCSDYPDTSTDRESLVVAKQKAAFAIAQLESAPPQDVVELIEYSEILRDLLSKANALCRIRAERIKELEQAITQVEPAPPQDVSSLVEALEIIAGKKHCADSLMSNQDVAIQALAKWEGSK